MRFPVFSSREDAEANLHCFNCHHVVGDRSTYQESRYPAGRGQYGAMCRDCGMTTYYDITPSSSPSSASQLERDLPAVTPGAGSRD